jgi:hypothetical protein
MICLSGSRARIAQSSFGCAASTEIWSTFEAASSGRNE